ncbi:hypothetical protein BGZ63DRAFT_421186 [Mariannaea sp. PMI_226]|nr:hypothetical protein BGZ63DRAFT_421186 [Mariannaea sp. PMI_226]
MDFTGQYSFPGTQPYHHFMPITPLTPSHSHSAPSDEFNPSPPETFENLPHANEQFSPFDYGQGFTTNPHPPNAFPSPPTPNHSLFAGQQPRHGSLPRTMQPMKGSDGSSEDGVVARGTSEEDDSLTPAQSRRKAQNRAAQRAFRERKEKHVKDLEAKLADLEAAQQKASVENERLKRDLQKMSTENEILRATSGGMHKGSTSSEPPSGLVRFNSSEFYSNVLQNHTNKTPSHRIVTADDGERLLAAGATWDFIINHDLFKRGLIDVGDVSDRLKHTARCDGQGPVFSERSIMMAIEQSVASGSDDLL